MGIRLDDDDDDIDVQMAPLIDCVFLLTAFFLVATTLRSTERVLRVDLPGSQAATVEIQPRAVRVAIDRGGDLYVGTERADLASLRVRLTEAGRNDPQCQVLIDGDKQAPMQALVRVLDACQSARLTNVRINSRPEVKPQ